VIVKTIELILSIDTYNLQMTVYTTGYLRGTVVTCQMQYVTILSNILQFIMLYVL